MCNKFHISTKVPHGTILTPVACANIINELIKCLLYQKSQIPYPFLYLKKAVTKKRQSEGSNSEEPVKLSIQNYFRTASKAYDTIVNAFSNIESELSNENSVKEIVFLFGSTYNLAKESCTIIIPRLQHYHKECVHFNDTQKCVRNILRVILTSDEWKLFAENSIPITNMYILLKKSETMSNNFFLPIDNFILNSKINQLEVKVDYNCFTKSSCCSKVPIFGQELADNYENNIDHLDKTELIYNWYLANISLRGYKEIFINNVSASELW